MMPHLFVITHPEVTFDARRPVPEWALSETGLRRAAALALRPWVPSIGAVYSSTEPKALSTAAPLADACGRRVRTHAGLCEIDRSATGVLPPDVYDVVTSEFFAQPDRSARGWERAVDAQRRVVDAVAEVMADAPAGRDVAIVTHGGVATLLVCHHGRQAIRRSADQPGQGHYVVMDRGTMTPLTGWLKLENEWERDG
jgi:broad specificity phosphatase PhoE